MNQNFFGDNTPRRLPHPPYSLDVSPSDFCLFAKVKSALIGRETPTEINLLKPVIEILNGISDAELQRVFRSWVEYIKRVIPAGGII
jgi:hypothetical protein